MKPLVQVTRWTGSGPPTIEGLTQLMSDEGLRPYSWSNGPRDKYSAHTHGYGKVIFVVTGSITFGLPEQNRNVTLNPGDRLDLPSGTVHDAVVGPDGVICLEGHQ